MAPPAFFTRAALGILPAPLRDLHDMHFKHLCELADLRRELNATRAALDELRAATLARQQAEAALAELYRERAIARARAAERDPALPLN